MSQKSGDSFEKKVSKELKQYLLGIPVSIKPDIKIGGHKQDLVLYYSKRPLYIIQCKAVTSMKQTTFRNQMDRAKALFFDLLHPQQCTYAKLAVIVPQSRFVTERARGEFKRHDIKLLQKTPKELELFVKKDIRPVVDSKIKRKKYLRKWYKKKYGHKPKQRN